MVENPQYILKDDDPSFAVVLHEVYDNREHFRLILKLAIEEGTDKSNSVITFMKIGNKKFQKYLRNKVILYKKE